MKKVLGGVPAELKVYPESARAAGWAMMKSTEDQSPQGGFVAEPSVGHIERPIERVVDTANGRKSCVAPCEG